MNLFFLLDNEAAYMEAACVPGVLPSFLDL